MKIETFLDYNAIVAGQCFPVHLAVRFAAPEFRSGRTQPIAFGLVIDRSGSMGGRPLEGAKAAAKVVASNLRKDDLLAITVFDDQAHVALPLQPVRSAEAVKSLIEDIQTGGGTNLTAGWSLCRDELRNAPANTPRRLLLLSDGLLNIGITEPLQVGQIVSQGLELDGTRSSCLGFGNGYDEDLLADLADATGGSFYDATDPERLPQIFAAELDGLQRIAAQNLRLRFRHLMFCDGALQLSNYPWHEMPDGRVELAIGDLVSEEERTLVLALDVAALPPLPEDAETNLEGEELVELEVLWDAIGEDGIASKSWLQTVRVRAVQDLSQIKPNSEVIPWVATQQAAWSIRGALDAADRDQHIRARALLNRTRLKLEAMGQHGDVQDGLNLVREMESRLDPEDGWSIRDRKLARYASADFSKMSSEQAFVAEDATLAEPSYKQRRKSER
ncbi:MAG: VWA domain-containing protein [Opitutales bacterium]